VLVACRNDITAAPTTDTWLDDCRAVC